MEFDRVLPQKWKGVEPQKEKSYLLKEYLTQKKYNSSFIPKLLENNT